MKVKEIVRKRTRGRRRRWWIVRLFVGRLWLLLLLGVIRTMSVVSGKVGVGVGRLFPEAGLHFCDLLHFGGNQDLIPGFTPHGHDLHRGLHEPFRNRNLLRLTGVTVTPQHPPRPTADTTTADITQLIRAPPHPGTCGMPVRISMSMSTACHVRPVLRKQIGRQISAPIVFRLQLLGHLAIRRLALPSFRLDGSYFHHLIHIVDIDHGATQVSQCAGG